MLDIIYKIVSIVGTIASVIISIIALIKSNKVETEMKKINIQNSDIKQEVNNSSNSEIKQNIN